MIKIVKSTEIEESFFNGRDFGDSIDAVKDVLKDIQKNGDSAVKNYSKKFDAVTPENFLIDEADLKNAADMMQKDNPELYNALCYSRDQALRFAKKQRECFTDFETELEPGVFTGQKNIPVERAGVYVPAGRFPLLSSVVMTVTPAVAAGVDEVILCTPPREHPADKTKAYADRNIMAAAYICGIRKAFAVGGSQAIGAMAFGTESIPKVDVIAGPGNKFVAEAKKLVYGTCGIDMIAGPTEVFVIADSSANPEWVAADLLAQAEHDVVAQPVLALADAELAKKVSEEIERQLEVLPPETVIERITGDGDKSKLVAPFWSADKIATLGGIDKRLAELNTWQGKLYTKKSEA